VADSTVLVVIVHPSKLFESFLFGFRFPSEGVSGSGERLSISDYGMMQFGALSKKSVGWSTRNYLTFPDTVAIAYERKI